MENIRDPNIVETFRKQFDRAKLHSNSSNRLSLEKIKKDTIGLDMGVDKTIPKFKSNSAKHIHSPPDICTLGEIPEFGKVSLFKKELKTFVDNFP
jgi:hypothetical protein